MLFLKKIWTWLIHEKSRVSQKAHPDLNAIDIAKIVKELKLTEEARRLGEAGLPSADATTMSGRESAVVQCVE